MKEKICKRCGNKFMPHASRQYYCRELRKFPCPICGKEFEAVCQSKLPKTCNNLMCMKIARNTSSAVHTCRICGQQFSGGNGRQLDCLRPIQKNCVICGKPYDTKCGTRYVLHTCSSPECAKAYKSQMSAASMQKETLKCAWCGEDFNPVHPSQIYCDRQHYNNCKICGKRFPIDKILQTKDIRQTCSDECRQKLSRIDNKQNSPEAKRKREQTCLKLIWCFTPF